MKLFTEVSVPEAPVQLEPGASAVSVGSCFAETISDFLAENRFPTLCNPFGTLYNPVSIADVLIHAVNETLYDESDLLYEQGRYIPLSHGTRFSGTDRESVLSELNRTDAAVRQALEQASLLIITLGTAHCWNFTEKNRIAGNCHRLADSRFTRELLSPQNIESVLENLFTTLSEKYPHLQTLITVSPVRHIRGSLTENSRSKAALICAVGELTSRFPNLLYFPAYEIMIDELRDYRFYDESLVDPSETAKIIIRERFTASMLSEESRRFISAWKPILQALRHRINPAENSSLFAESGLKKIRELSKQFPQIDFSSQTDYFTRLK